MQKRLAAYAEAGIEKNGYDNGESPKKKKRNNGLSPIKRKRRNKKFDKEGEEAGGGLEGGGAEPRIPNSTKEIADEKQITGATDPLSPSVEATTKEESDSNNDPRRLGTPAKDISRFSFVRPRLFSFKSTKEVWENRVAAEGSKIIDSDSSEEELSMPKELAEADTDEELESTASNSGSDNEGEDREEKKEKNEENRKRKEIEEEIARELAAERARVRGTGNCRGLPDNRRDRDWT